MVDGSPKYCEWHSTTSFWNVVFIFSVWLRLIAKLTISVDLWKFTNCPDAFPYWSNTSLITVASSLFALKNNRLSSANSRWDIAGHRIVTFKPWTALSASALLIKVDKALEQSKNKYGDRGHPCLKPLCGWINTVNSFNGQVTEYQWNEG